MVILLTKNTIGRKGNKICKDYLLPTLNIGQIKDKKKPAKIGGPHCLGFPKIFIFYFSTPSRKATSLSCLYKNEGD